MSWPFYPDCVHTAENFKYVLHFLKKRINNFFLLQIPKKPTQKKEKSIKKEQKKKCKKQITEPAVSIGTDRLLVDREKKTTLKLIANSIFVIVLPYIFATTNFNLCASGSILGSGIYNQIIWP